MRPCSNCRSVGTELLDQGFITRLVSSLGGDPLLQAWVCQTCRHVDFWVDEPTTEEDTQHEAAADPDDTELAGNPTPTPIPAS
jgi:hypothetical protein